MLKEYQILRGKKDSAKVLQHTARFVYFLQLKMHLFRTKQRSSAEIAGDLLTERLIPNFAAKEIEVRPLLAQSTMHVALNTAPKH